MRSKQTKRLVILAFFTAIILVQNFVPLVGYIPLGPLNLTLIHITVIVAAFVLGPVDGALVGGVWGTITFIRAFVWPTSPLATIVFVNPLIAILPRVMIGLVAGSIFKLLQPKVRHTMAAMIPAAILGSLTNTLLVLGQIFLFYQSKSQMLYQIDTKALLPYLLAVIGTNGIPEAIAAAIIAPMISAPLLLRFHRKS
ncbi:MAG: ECF transporter S component [Liquorilactobacillus nagelii]|uniref:ECF transporter S component n=1 Tax=Liquorilactobacillus nagelii TaxID=82688 RepID=A0A3Q8CE88_9LACO|nr:ECF transporter S component [Liquorilactobacillus nagelii]AUJ31357.1 ECF transporter S component [Liquorilactobacillus nagelii]MCC7616832.1 ECF transporter S component [Liquorilactobacillus nagelii]MCP9315576.1 ECF transporter S component [Liquorilactobacillus nagelii]ULQ50394.1 ECF transporter S component [Liquorilactobacillus nagelii]